MKSGDKAFVHLAGVVYVGIVKRGIPIGAWHSFRLGRMAEGYQSEAIANDLL